MKQLLFCNQQKVVYNLMDHPVLNLRLEPDEDLPLLPPVLYDAASADIPAGFPLPWNNY